MNPGVEIRIKHNLKDLKLSAMLRELGSLLRDARENQQNHEEFLLNLTETEVNTRAENSLKRRLKEAKFPLIKPMETFDFERAHSHFPGYAAGTGLCVFAICFKQFQRPAL
ncbi:MAG: ATP-binding protein [Desulfobacter postgatei]|uniref:ATP-binding protein n=1 Tax=Desulfobacter postgatei TaxID=2293 RepID=UPI0023F0CCA9|nr:ATP-binding protein [Desulfobacter postgatei]MDD4275351.1 ATP-binding protein [Desulfobacter postgatei]